MKNDTIKINTNLQNEKMIGARGSVLESKIKKIRPWIYKADGITTSDLKLQHQLKKVKFVNEEKTFTIIQKNNQTLNQE